MGQNHDYQNEMTTETRSLDTAGEQAAEAVTPETAGVHEEKVVTTVGQQQHSKMVGAFGALPGVTIPTDYTLDRLDYFKRMSMETGAQRNVLNPFSSGMSTAAYQSQLAMATGYELDYGHLTDAQRDFDLLLPVANLAARSFAKSHEIGQLTGFSDLKGPKLSNNEQRALQKATRAQHTPLDQETSLAAASDELTEARKGVVAAADLLAAKASTTTIERLKTELAQAKSDKEAIQAKIHKAQRVIGYFRTAGSLVAGGAGFVHENISSGKAHPTQRPDEIDLRDSNVETAKNAGDHVESGSDIASDAAEFGLKLYYSKEMDKIDAQIDTLTTLVSEEHRADVEKELRGARMQFFTAQQHYGNVVSKYLDRMNDRRKHMASLGSAADKIVDPRGVNSNASDSMLWTTTIMETQSLLSTSIESGDAAASTINGAHKAVSATRTRHWGTASDAYGPNNTPRVEGTSGPDMQALSRMRDLVSWWLEGARDVKTTIDDVAERQGEPILENVGHTGKY